MAGCNTQNIDTDYHAGTKRVLGWVTGGAVLFAIAGFLEAAAVIGALTLGVGLIVAAAILIVAVAGAAVGFAIGFAVNWFDRLFVQDPATITIAGCVLCAGKNSGFPPFHDNDWTFNLGPPSFALLSPLEDGLTLDEVRNRDAPGAGPAGEILDPSSGLPALHCEIGSAIGDAAAVGGAIGSVAGAVAGAVVGAVICAALGIATFGIGAALCLLVVAIAILVGAAAGFFVGDAIGAGVGAIIDEVKDFDEQGEAVTRGCIMALTGRWITDSSHQHNEIHDVESVQLIECNDCVGDGMGEASTGLVAAVGIGRHPTGRDP